MKTAFLRPFTAIFKPFAAFFRPSQAALRRLPALVLVFLTGSFFVGNFFAGSFLGEGFSSPSSAGAQGEKFTIAIMPDTQNEVISEIQIEGKWSNNRAKWLADNKEALDLRFVIHTGDLLNWPEYDHSQAPIASEAMEFLDRANIPYLIAPGNHDTGATGVGGSAHDTSRTRELVRVTSQLNKYFTPERLKPTASFEEGKVENSYTTFEAGGRNWMVLAFELWPRTEAIEWAKEAIASHPDHNVLIATHSYLNSNGSIFTSSEYGSNSPQYLFDNLIKRYSNIKMVFSGHTGMAGARVDYGIYDNKIASVLGTFHSNETNPVQLLEIDTEANIAKNKFYAPLDGREWPEYAQEFINMDFVKPFNRDTLAELIDEFSALGDGAGYTPESRDSFKGAFERAVAIRDNSGATAEEVFAAVDTLIKTKQNLLKMVSFNDVTNDAWYFNAISFISAKRIASGTGGGNFGPGLKLKRGDCLVMLMKGYEIEPDIGSLNNFLDAGNTYYTDYLAAAKRLKISGGVGENMFAPEKEISRQEVFTMIYNAIKGLNKLPGGDTGKALSDFSDAGKIQPWASEAMAYFVKAGVISGNAGGELTPESAISRAEMAQVLYNLLKPQI